MSKVAEALARVKAYCAMRIPAGLKSDHIHGIGMRVMNLGELVESENKVEPTLLVSDLNEIVKAMEEPGRVLKKREEDILKVFPMFWDNIFGGFIFALDQAHGTLASDPKQAKHILDGLRTDLENLREFMIHGEVEPIFSITKGKDCKLERREAVKETWYVGCDPDDETSEEKFGKRAQYKGLGKFTDEAGKPVNMFNYTYLLEEQK